MTTLFGISRKGPDARGENVGCNSEEMIHDEICLLPGRTVVGRKVRKQLYIEARQEKMLKRQAKELGVSQAELIRQGLDVVLARAEGPAADSKAWEDERAFIRERARIPALGGDRAWTREELYHKRLSR